MMPQNKHFSGGFIEIQWLSNLTILKKLILRQYKSILGVIYALTCKLCLKSPTYQSIKVYYSLQSQYWINAHKYVKKSTLWKEHPAVFGGLQKPRYKEWGGKAISKLSQRQNILNGERAMQKGAESLPLVLISPSRCPPTVVKGPGPYLMLQHISWLWAKEELWSPWSLSD